MSDKISISFDEDNKIRVLEADKFKETDLMRSESMEFMKKLIQFDETVNLLVETMEEQGKKVELTKLKAIGQRNKVENEQENRKRKQQEIQNLLSEKKNELSRLQLELQSLIKVDKEQKDLIEKLTNNKL